MKRRSFFNRISASAIGLSLVSSCSIQDDKNPTRPDSASHLKKDKIPGYRSSIKSHFTKSKLKTASDKIILAMIGVGGWGTNLALNLSELNENIQVKYVCDVDDTRGGRAISVLEKRLKFKPIRVRDMRKVFDDKDVDGVIIATPQHWHALAMIWACQAGKDVYVEKCISHSIYEGQKMIEAAMKYERVVQCGMQNRSFDCAMSAKDYIQSGKLGKIIAVDVKGLIDGPLPFNEKENIASPETIDWDMWLGPAPKVPYNVSRNKSHLFYWDYSGGMALGNDSIHQLDLTRMVLGDPEFPKSVYCAGGRFTFDDNRETPDYQMTTFDYGEFIMTLQTGEFTPYMSKTSLEIRLSETFPEWMQNSTKIIIHGTKYMMCLGRMGGGWQVFDKDLQLVDQDSGLFPLKPHLQNFLDCIRSRNFPNSNIIEGHKSAVLAHLANYSYRSGNKQLLFSSEIESIINDPKAQALDNTIYRKGFEIPAEV